MHDPCDVNGLDIEPAIRHVACMYMHGLVVPTDGVYSTYDIDVYGVCCRKLAWSYKQVVFFRSITLHCWKKHLT